MQRSRLRAAAPAAGQTTAGTTSRATAHTILCISHPTCMHSTCPSAGWYTAQLNADFAAALVLLCPSPAAVPSPIRHISLFEDFSMMVLADTAGWLTVTDIPTPAELARQAAVRLPGVIPGAPTPSRWAPMVARIKAHKGGIVAAASLVGLRCQGALPGRAAACVVV